MAKNTSVTAIDAAVNRGFAKNVTSRIGWSVCRSQSTNAGQQHDGDHERRDDHDGSLQPCRAPR